MLARWRKAADPGIGKTIVTLPGGPVKRVVSPRSKMACMPAETGARHGMALRPPPAAKAGKSTYLANNAKTWNFCDKNMGSLFLFVLYYLNLAKSLGGNLTPARDDRKPFDGGDFRPTAIVLDLRVLSWEMLVHIHSFQHGKRRFQLGKHRV
jgi:hypothetical protein